MNKHLFFICPTDSIEFLINRLYKSENYFITSLGNSMTFKMNEKEEIKSFIKSKKITEITFVLRDNNKVFQDAITNQEYSTIAGVRSFYNQMKALEVFSEKKLNQNYSNDNFILKHLNKKVKDLKCKLDNWSVENIKFNAIVYSNTKQSLHIVYQNKLNLKINLN